MAETSIPTKPIDIGDLAAGRFVTGRAYDNRFRIICQHGELIIVGDWLYFRCRRPGEDARSLQRLPYATVAKSDSSETLIQFPIDRFDDVASVARAKPFVRGIRQ